MHRHFKLLLGVGWLLAAMSATAADLTISGIYTRYADETELDTVAIGAGELVAITSNEVPTGRMVVGTDGSTGYSYVFDEGGDFDWTGAHDFSAATVTLLDTHIPTDLTIQYLRDAQSVWLSTAGTTDGEDFRLVLGTTQGFATRIDIKDASSTIVLYSDSVVVGNTLTVTGAVSAASFAGDGSGITNIAALGQLNIHSDVNSLTTPTVGHVLSYQAAGWTNAAAGAADNLGNHTATETLKMATFAISNAGPVYILEQADASADIATMGQIWVNTATPNELWFTDDAGTDVQLGLAGGSGDSITVGGTAIDTTAEFTNTGNVAFSVADGGAGGPDDISASVTAAVTLDTEWDTIGEIETATGTDIVTTNANDITSAQLAQLLSNETGTGLDVFSTSAFLTNATLAGATLTGTITATNSTFSVSNLTAQVGSFSTSLAADSATITNTLTATTVVRDHPVYLLSTNRTWTATELCDAYVYVTGVSTQTLPAVDATVSAVFVADGAHVVTIDPNASDQMKLDGAALDTAGDAIVSGGTAGEIAAITYYSGDGWYAATDGWASE